MRNYSSRLAKLEAALKPAEDVVIRIVYVDNWRDGYDSGPGKRIRLDWGEQGPPIDYRRDLHKLAPVARVAPGLIEALQDDTADSPLPAVLSSPGNAVAATTGTLNTALPGDPQNETPWTFETARWMYQEPPAGPSLRKARATARKAAAAAQAQLRREDVWRR